MTPAVRLFAMKLTDLASRGMTIREAAEEVDAKFFYIYQFARRHRIPFKAGQRGYPAKGPDARSDEMRQMYLDGAILEEIGAKFQITRERVRQIITKHYGSLAKDGGQTERARRRKRTASDKRNARFLEHWGCTYRQYRGVLKRSDKPTYAYVGQKRNARTRDIGWELNFWQWWTIWQQSGKWAERGRGKDKFCMCRLNDIGPYSPDNVYIATCTENAQDHWVNRRAATALNAELA